jgi:hypothetical protein
MRFFRVFRPLGILIAIAILSGCATMSITAKPWGQMTPKEKSSQFIQTYNTQYQDTMFMASNPNITEEQKWIVRTKKAILTKAWPIIKVYDAVAAGGGVPSPQDEQAILELINQLATMGG